MFYCLVPHKEDLDQKEQELFRVSPLSLSYPTAIISLVPNFHWFLKGLPARDLFMLRPGSLHREMRSDSLGLRLWYSRPLLKPPPFLNRVCKIEVVFFRCEPIGHAGRGKWAEPCFETGEWEQEEQKRGVSRGDSGRHGDLRREKVGLRPSGPVEEHQPKGAEGHSISEHV